MGSASGWVASQLPEDDLELGGIIDVDVPPQTERHRAEGGVWFATKKSLLHLHQKMWRRWSHDDGLPAPLSAIACGLSDAVYLGTEKGEIYSWSGPEHHKLLEQIPDTGISCLRLGYHRQTHQPLLVAGCGTPYTPSHDNLCVTLYGDILTSSGRERRGQASAPSIVHSEPLSTGTRGSTVDITFNAAGIPHLLFRDNRYPDKPSFIFHRLRFRRRTKGEASIQWHAFSIIKTPCTTIEYMRTQRSSGLWVGTPGGLYYLNPSKHSSNLGILLNIPSTGPVYDIFQDSRNWLWVSGHEGLFLHAKSRWWRFIDPPGDILFKLDRIVEDQMGNIYVVRGDQYFWLKWSDHFGRGGVSLNTLKKLTEPVKTTAASLSL